MAGLGRPSELTRLLGLSLLVFPASIGSHKIFGRLVQRPGIDTVPQARVRAFLVGRDQAAVAGDVCAQDRGKPALDLLRHGPPFAQLTADQPNLRTEEL